MSEPRRLPDLALAAVMAAYLLPIWCFRYVPTQDGAAHVANAVLLRDYGQPGTRHHEFFELNDDPLPNWSSHLLLAAFATVVPPLVAEKLLLSLAIIGFALASRYFLAAWPGACPALVPFCLLFVYNRCLLMGFYNYCLSLPLVFLILGAVARMGAEVSLRTAVGLAALFLVTYFTHLAGYLQAAIGAFLLAATLPSRGIRFLTVTAAILPSAGFAADYLLATGPPLAAITDALGRNFAASAETSRATLPLGRDLFIPYHGWSFPVGRCAFGLFLVLSLTGLLQRRATKQDLRPWCSLLALASVMTVIYFAGPGTFGRHGGYLKARFAIVLPIVWLPLLRLPQMIWLRGTLLGAMCLVLGLQLVATMSHFSVANRALDEYMAGLDAAGKGRVLYVMQSRYQEPYEVSYLVHASHYYCLESNTTSLDNYEANTPYFPVRYRPGIPRGRGERRDFSFYGRRREVDQILAWEPPAAGPPPVGFRETFRSGSLAIFDRAR